MTVRDAMHVGVVSCDPSTSVRDAVRLMNEKRLRSLVVLDFDCGLAGIISEMDIVAARLVHEGGKPWDQMTVGEIMTNRVLTVTPDMSLQEAARILVNHRIHRVVVADPDDLCKPIGILSLGDIMRYLERVESGEQSQAQPEAASETKPSARPKRSTKSKRTTKRASATRKKTARKSATRA
ncbi:MAG: CBS domain-containing protein [Thermoflexales bacterium]|nr:CBS domain-containing protein [Thermoflexales bacterium]MCX7939584.1 CBS domain-containing protein [Thermoflexales bacterium]MDW8054249.1 CBS domain-containing protein [Anaerolineae bacterium]MDW8292231.1 CBS domain-containing protein [Anaerolineae bacterium]